MRLRNKKKKTKRSVKRTAKMKQNIPKKWSFSTKAWPNFPAIMLWPRNWEPWRNVLMKIPKKLFLVISKAIWPVVFSGNLTRFEWPKHLLNSKKLNKRKPRKMKQSVYVKNKKELWENNKKLSKTKNKKRDLMNNQRESQENKMIKLSKLWDKRMWRKININLLVNLTKNNNDWYFI